MPAERMENDRKRWRDVADVCERISSFENTSQKSRARWTTSGLVEGLFNSWRKNGFRNFRRALQRFKLPWWSIHIRGNVSPKSVRSFSRHRIGQRLPVSQPQSKRGMAPHRRQISLGLNTTTFPTSSISPNIRFNKRYQRLTGKAAVVFGSLKFSAPHWSHACASKFHHNRPIATVQVKDWKWRNVGCQSFTSERLPMKMNVAPRYYTLIPILRTRGGVGFVYLIT